MLTKHRSSHLLRFFHLINTEGLPAPGEPDYNPCAGNNTWWTMQTGYSGITTPLIDKLVSTKA
jgi:hypothetical protein